MPTVLMSPEFIAVLSHNYDYPLAFYSLSIHTHYIRQDSQYNQECDYQTKGFENNFDNICRASVCTNNNFQSDECTHSNFMIQKFCCNHHSSTKS